MDGLGISFAEPSPSEPSSSPPSSPTPLRELPHGCITRERSTTNGSDDSFMESKLSEFDDWKKTVTRRASSYRMPALPPIPSATPSPTKEAFPPLHSLSLSDDARHHRLRAKARALAARAAAHKPPDVDAHPAFRRQDIRLRKKRNAVATQVPKCWRPGNVIDEEPWQCCEQADDVCEDCGYVLCEECGSRCRGPDWCVVTGCVRCQTRLGVNICTPHLRELRARLAKSKFRSSWVALEFATLILCDRLSWSYGGTGCA